MRALNMLQNIDVASRELKEILDNRSDPRAEQDTRLQTAFEDTQDGIDVLNQGGIFPVGRDAADRTRAIGSRRRSSPAIPVSAAR